MSELNEKRILIVEDDPLQRMVLKKHLEKNDFRVLEAANGREALDVFQNQSPIRLIITDLQMPVMDGHELIVELRNRELKYTYIVALSALGENSSIIQALREGADDYLKKPVNVEELKLRLESGLRMLKLENLEAIIYSFASIAETRSKETGQHLQRVKFYTNLLVTYIANKHPEMNITNNYIDTISEASILHDIGKVGIPDAVLNKPGKLTDEEFDVMKTHTTIGGNILHDIYESNHSVYIKIATDIAMYHHEKWNGRGYPEGLAGEDIPLCARIMALADVFDALVSPRVYKPAFPFEKARDIILSESGAHFDERVVEAFREQQDRFREIMVEYRDE